ncbi:MAG: hypothetical protein U1F11_06470 [Steroidobacteraceae bacterium]
MQASGIKRRFVLGAVAVTVIGMLVAALAVAYHFQRDRQLLTAAARQQARGQLEGALSARAVALAHTSATLLRDVLVSRDARRISQALQAVRDDPALGSLTVLDPQGQALYNFQRPEAATEEPAERMPAGARSPVRSMVETYPMGTLRTLGSTPRARRAARYRRQRARRRPCRRQLELALIIGALALAALGMGLLAARWAGRSLAEPIGALVRSAERFGQGDYAAGGHGAR